MKGFQALNVTKIREDFPILSRKINGHKLAFLDSAASSQKPRQVIEAVTDYYYNHHANVHRGAHTLAAEATSLYEEAREEVAAFVGAASDELIFTRNATEAINLVARTWAHENLRPGDEIIVSVAEHHANFLPWLQLAEENGVRLRVAGLKANERLDLGELKGLLNDRTRLIATYHMSNVLGDVNPLPEIAALARSVGAKLLVDGAQAAPHLSVDVRALGADFYAFSGHKMLGPTGIGALYGRRELLEAMPPFLRGGEMIQRVSLEGATFAEPPKRFEAGTPSIAQAVGLAAAVKYLSALGMPAVEAHATALTRRALRGLTNLPGTTLYGPKEGPRGAVIAFNIEGVHPHDLVTLLDAKGIAVRAGNHCAQPLGRALGVNATARASFYLYNTEEEVDRLIAGVDDARKRFAAA